MPNWCKFEIAGDIAWPRKQSTVIFGDWVIEAFPSTRKNAPSLQIDIQKNRVDEVGARSILHQLLSVCSWCDDAASKLLDGFCGSPAASPIGRERSSVHLTSILDQWPYSRSPLNDDEQRMALALYRDSLWQYHYGSIPYTVFGFFKILEIRHGGIGRKHWLRTHLFTNLEAGEFDKFWGLSP